MRVHLQNAPAPDGGTSIWVSRHELRSTDGYWSSPDGTNLAKASLSKTSESTLGGPFSQGITRWFGSSFWFPNNDPVGEFFNWPVAGSSDGWFTVGFDLHATGVLAGTYSGPFQMMQKTYFAQANQELYMRMSGGSAATVAANLQDLPTGIRLSNGDGTRFTGINPSLGTPTYNYWHRLLVGLTFSSVGSVGSSPGHATIILDGVTIYDGDRPTCYDYETSSWGQFQNYTPWPVVYSYGMTSSVVYFYGACAGLTEADVVGPP